MLSVRELCLERHFQPVFQPLSFELGAGELLLVTGPNGCGKTTLIRLLAGLTDPTSGTIDSSSKFLRYIGHDAAIKAELSVYENLAFYAGLSGQTSSLEAVLKTMGLRDCAEQAGRTLSAGQRKRTALARLLLGDAPLWLLDEPYTNLDADGVELIDMLLDRHLSSGGSCVMATHGTHRPTAGQASWQMRELQLQPAALAA